MPSTGAEGAVGAQYNPEKHFIGHSEPPPAIPMDKAIAEVSRRAYQVGELRAVTGMLLHYIAYLEDLLYGADDIAFERSPAVEKARLLLERGDG